MLFTIITPSYRNSDWLRLCVASVADQRAEHEHIVQDAGSDDGTLEWLAKDRRVELHVERDEGMYDAINRGLRRARGDLVAYLNCDEQYLPGTLVEVAEFFRKNPEVDVLFGNIVMVDQQGRYLQHRKVQVPLRLHTWVVHLSTLSCAMFFRRRIVSELGNYFNPRWRAVGDGEWMLRLIENDIRMAALGRFTSTFTFTGNNLGQASSSQREALELRQTAPGWVRAIRPLLILHHRLRRWRGGMYSQPPFSYAVYTKASPLERQVIEVKAPVSRWSRTL